ncbi:PREDICTED: Krueppel-like factor 12 isoform X2 [Cercocebus atys]|uniref:Krueppel-like factor 12 isoform X2 n=1 Tax=Cercocebus atys TaxID=9531 RepID=UPI0005F37042|nr:PREDICTED: Krueppel-like factor 12 isoform X2 [Cercocebus atys]
MNEYPYEEKNNKALLVGPSLVVERTVLSHEWASPHEEGSSALEYHLPGFTAYELCTTLRTCKIIYGLLLLFLMNINTFENRMLMLDGMPAVRVKTELLESEQGSPNVHNYPDMEAVPLLLNNVKGEPPEDSLSVDHFQTQTEPVDLSINKARTSPTAVSSSPVSMTASASSPSSTSTSSSSSSRLASSPTVITSVSSASSSSTVLTPGPLVASASGVAGQQFLHIIHPVPPSSPMNLQSNKLSHVHRIPVVVQSVPVVYTAVRSPGNVNNTIVVPLLEDGRGHGKAQMDPRGLSPRQSKSDSDDDDLPNVTLDSVNETGSTALSIARAVQEVHPSPVSRVRGNRMNNQKFPWRGQEAEEACVMRGEGPRHSSQRKGPWDSPKLCQDLKINEAAPISRTICNWACFHFEC